MWEFNGAW